MSRLVQGGVASPVHVVNSEDFSSNVTIANTPLPVDIESNLSAPFPIRFGDSPSIDAFDRLRVSNPVTTFESSLLYDESPIFWYTSITNNSGLASVTHNANKACVELTVGANDVIIRQTKTFHKYFSGKSSLILQTFVSNTDSESIKRKGYFYGDNGIFFEMNGGTPRLGIRSKTSGVPVDNMVDQSDWNVDKFDGTGASGVTLDFNMSQILIIDLEWLGVGRVRTGFVIDGIIYYAHYFNNANNLNSVYMSTANLPIRYEIVGSADLVGTSTLDQICSQVSSEGGLAVELGKPFSVSNGASLISVTARRPILSIRPKLTFNGHINRIQAILSSISFFSEDASVYYEIMYGGTINPTTWVSANDNSAYEYNVDATTMTGGIRIASGYVSATGTNRSTGVSVSQAENRLPLALDIDGNHPTTPFTDVISLVVTSTVGATDVGGEISWKEI